MIQLLLLDVVLPAALVPLIMVALAGDLRRAVARQRRQRVGRVFANLTANAEALHAALFRAQESMTRFARAMQERS